MRVAKYLLGAAVALAAIAQSASPSSAQTWPTRTVKFILTLGPGAGADISARLLADKLSAKWGQPVVVENKPGGDGFVAINAFVGAKDDHVLLYGPSSSFTAHPFLHEKLPYDPRDLAPIARVSSTIVSISVPPTLNVKTLKDVFDMARAQPGKLNWASITGATDLILRSYIKKTGLDMARVPYRNPVQALTDVVDGRIHFYWAAYAIVRPQAQAGKIKVIAITSSEPAAILPGVPTTTQAGYPELLFDGNVGLFGPRDMPGEVRERIASDIKAVLADKAIADRLVATGQVLVPGSAKEFAAAIDKQRTGLTEVTKVLGIKPATN
jgi:tripartite-type tricarboxylate transporter receptor subunit TctC